MRVNSIIQSTLMLLAIIVMPVQAKNWYLEPLHAVEQAVKEQDPEAQYQLAMMYRVGQGVEKDLSVAADLFERAARQGHSLAQYQLGQQYKYGLGVEQNARMAEKWLTKAAGGEPKKRPLPKPH